MSAWIGAALAEPDQTPPAAIKAEARSIERPVITNSIVNLNLRVRRGADSATNPPDQRVMLRVRSRRRLDEQLFEITIAR